MLKDYIFNVDRENLKEFFYYLAHNTKNKEYSKMYNHAYLTVKKCYNEDFLHRIHRMAWLIEEELEINNKYFAGMYTKMLNVLIKEMNDAEEWEEQEKTICEESEVLINAN